MDSLTFIIMNKVDEKSDEYRALSSILGAFTGDTLGSFCKFSNFSLKNHALIFAEPKSFNPLNRIDGKGHITENSEIAMGLAQAILDSSDKNILNPNFIYYYYGLWFNSNPKSCRITIKNALKHFNNKSAQNNCYTLKIREKVSRINSESLTNGTMMRNSPLSVYIYYRNKKKIKELLFSSNMSPNEATIENQDLKSKISSSINNNQNQNNSESFNENDNDNNIDANTNYESPISEFFQKNYIFLNPNTPKYGELYLLIKQYAEIESTITHPNPEITSADSLIIFLSICGISGLNAYAVFHSFELLLSHPLFSVDEGDKLAANKAKVYLKEIKAGKKLTSDNTICDKTMGAYYHALKMTIYYVYNFEHLFRKHKKQLFRKIIDEICDCGGDTDTNAAIVGSVIGPLIGYKEFGEGINKMLEYKNPHRIIYSPIFMYIYVLYLKKIFITKEEIEEEENKKNELKKFKLLRPKSSHFRMMNLPNISQSSGTLDKYTKLKSKTEGNNSMNSSSLMKYSFKRPKSTMKIVKKPSLKNYLSKKSSSKLNSSEKTEENIQEPFNLDSKKDKKLLIMKIKKENQAKLSKKVSFNVSLSRSQNLNFINLTEENNNYQIKKKKSFPIKFYKKIPKFQSILSKRKNETPIKISSTNTIEEGRNVKRSKLEIDKPEELEKSKENYISQIETGVEDEKNVAKSQTISIHKPKRIIINTNSINKKLKIRLPKVIKTDLSEPSETSYRKLDYRFLSLLLNLCELNLKNYKIE